MKLSILKILETAFEQLGRFIAKWPFVVITLCLMCTGFCSVGFIYTTFSTNTYDIWDTNPNRDPQGSQSIKHREWVSSHFGDNLHSHTLIFSDTESEDGNILTPEAFRVMLDVHLQLTKPTQNFSFESICHRIPVPDLFDERSCRQKKDNKETNLDDEKNSELEDDYSDLYSYDDDNSEPKSCADIGKYNNSVYEENQKLLYKELPRETYCEFVEELETTCFEQSLLEIWMYDEDVILSLSKDDIIFAVNILDRSPYFGFKYNYEKLLGSIKRNSTGHIIGAKAALYHFNTVVDESKVTNTSLQLGNDPKKVLDEENIQWQDEVIRVALLADSNSSSTGVSVDVRMSKSEDDLQRESMFVDMQNVCICFSIMFVYTTVMLNGLTWTDMRPFLTGMGIFAVCLGVPIAYGITSLIGYPFMPHFAVLPFLMVGLGIDDMFVIMKTFRNLESLDKMNLEERIAQTLKHAGVSITVTSLTDVCVFAVGAVTVFPGLQAFCVACALGIAAIYLLQATWFVAWLVVDERRRASGLVCKSRCSGEYSVSTSITSLVSTPSKISNILDPWPMFSNLLDSRIFHAIIIIISASCLGVGIWGSLTIRQELIVSRFYPADSYLSSWMKNFYNNFDDFEQEFSIYTGSLEAKEDLERIDSLTSTLKSWVEQEHILVSMDNWWESFNQHIYVYWNITDWETMFDTNAAKDFQFYLSDFLHSPGGGKYLSKIKFNEPLVCNQPAPLITASSIPVSYLRVENRNEQRMNRKALEDLISSLHCRHAEDTFSYGNYYFIWDIDDHVGFELWRNLGLSMMCVVLITYALLNSLPACILVNLSVVISVIDVVGFVNFWGITIDIMSLFTIVLVVGICVDYPVHIVHSYLVSEGTKLERAKNSLQKIGPAVTNGGLTTFLSVIVLCGSQTHVFITIFKIFFLTVLFGLFHGVVLLPVLLCYIGPSNKGKSEIEPKENHSIANSSGTIRKYNSEIP